MAEVKTYTPVQFWQEATDSTNLSDYVVIGNCPTQPYGKNYQVKLGRGQIEGTDWTFLNLDMSVLKDYASKILNDTVIVEFSADVGQQMDSKAGLMASGVLDYDSFYDLKFGFDKKVGIYSRESAPNHAMALIGYDKVNDKITKWKVENSWGTDRGKDGFFLMTDEWFDKYGYDLVIPKKYLSPEHLKLWETPPVVLPFWDPLARVAQVGGYQD
jgi:bleomycin hydrolase